MSVGFYRAAVGDVDVLGLATRVHHHGGYVPTALDRTALADRSGHSRCPPYFHLPDRQAGNSANSAQYVKVYNVKQSATDSTGLPRSLLREGLLA